MPQHYWKNKEGIEEYQKVQMKYDETVFDLNYAEFLQRTRKSKNNQTWYTQLGRIKLSNGDEYLVASIYEVREDMLGNKLSFWRSKVDTYPIPEVEWKARRTDDGDIEKIPGRVTNISRGFSNSFEKKKVEKMLKDGLIVTQERGTGSNKVKTTQLYVQIEDGRPTITVESLDDFMNKSFEDLYKIGPLSQPQGSVI